MTDELVVSAPGWAAPVDPDTITPDDYYRNPTRRRIADLACELVGVPRERVASVTITERDAVLWMYPVGARFPLVRWEPHGYERPHLCRIGRNCDPCVAVVMVRRRVALPGARGVPTR